MLTHHAVGQQLPAAHPEIDLAVFGSAAPELALHTRVALGVGTFIAVAMTLVQVWRVRTGRFVPTITDSPGGTAE